LPSAHARIQEMTMPLIFGGFKNGTFMKRLGKYLLAGVLGLLAVAALALGAAVGFLVVFRPKLQPPSSETVERTPARLARGTYLVENLLSCKHCHSPPDTARFGMPLPADAAPFTGGLVLDRSFTDFPGVVQAPNITPDVETGVGSWTDGELIRAIREGVKRDGTTIFGMMPYSELRALSEEDVRSVVVYLRAQKPVRLASRKAELDFPVNLLSRLDPDPVVAPVHAPDRKDPVAWGGYLVRIAGCKHCHTPVDKGSLVEAEAFSGGFVFEIPSAHGRHRVVTSNITPDPTGFFGRATRDEWIGRVRSFLSIRDNPPEVQPGRNTMMLWLQYAGLTDEDLSAIYDYMKTVRPVHKVVEPFPDAPPDRAGGQAKVVPQP
jgi:hypothetical protein